MTLKGGTGQACAACKYQRRRCASDCQLAPYFPADQPKMFQNAHRLFGVSNILKILKQLDPSQKAIAMKSIKYQANMRDKYPVYGCLVEIQQLSYQIQMAEEELQAILAQLAYYRQRHQHQDISSSPNDSLSQLQLGMAPPGNALTHYDHALPHPNYSNTEYLDVAKENNDHNNNNNNVVMNSMWIQQMPYSNNTCNDTNSMAMQSQLSTAQPLSVQQETAQDYDEIYPFFDSTIDDRQSYIDSKEVYESSSESSLKDTRQSIEQMAENELKSAAACFSLTSVMN